MYRVLWVIFLALLLSGCMEQNTSVENVPSTSLESQQPDRTTAPTEAATTQEPTTQRTEELFEDIISFVEPDNGSTDAIMWRLLRDENWRVPLSLIDMNEDGIYEVLMVSFGGDAGVLLCNIAPVQEGWYESPYSGEIYLENDNLELYFDRENNDYFLYCSAINVFKGEVRGVYEGKYWLRGGEIQQELDEILYDEASKRSIDEWKSYLAEQKNHLQEYELVRTFSLNLIEDDVLQSERVYYSMLFPVCVDGKYEYIDKQGNLVTNNHFDKAEFFEDGQAYVEWDGKSGYMDLSGRVTFEKNPEMKGTVLNYVCEDGEYSEGLKIEGTSCITQSGKVVFQHEGICGKYQGGMIPYSENGRIGFLDRMGNEVIKAQYFSCNERGFRDGLALVATNAECSEWAYIDKRGQNIFSFSMEQDALGKSTSSEKFYCLVSFLEELKKEENVEGLVIDVDNDGIVEIMVHTPEAQEKIEKWDIYSQKEGAVFYWKSVEVERPYREFVSPTGETIQLKPQWYSWKEDFETLFWHSFDFPRKREINYNESGTDIYEKYLVNGICIGMYHEDVQKALGASPGEVIVGWGDDGLLQYEYYGDSIVWYLIEGDIKRVHGYIFYEDFVSLDENQIHIGSTRAEVINQFGSYINCDQKCEIGRDLASSDTLVAGQLCFGNMSFHFDGDVLIAISASGLTSD